ncbi:hypothetical protein [Acetobacterium tundrae]|uniref:Uncharacterized protein n=1 Tax=Acetobacterium tundrae TaxID=132932 RepID=A0ABR6WIV5_9FIRM|nr:hypothetical protein [Acetobacterium tundrae]MBC3796090.1 hypothetical protein [Acetobacterium tundrae]
MDKDKIESIFLNKQFSDFKWVTGDKIKVAQWVRVKCMYGCDSPVKKVLAHQIHQQYRNVGSFYRNMKVQ